MPTQPSAPRPHPPPPPAPAIYRAVTIAGRSQEEAAAENGVTQPTVSRAVKRFAAWRASTDPQDSGDLTLRQQERLDRWLSHERHEQIYAQALRLARRMEQPAITTRQGSSGDKQFSYEARKDQHAAAARFLRTAQRSADALTRLAANSPLNQEPLEEYTLRQALVALREQVEASGKAPTSNNPHHTVDRWLRALLGHEMFSHPADTLAPGSALGELIRAALANCHSATPEQLLQALANNPPPRQENDEDFNDNDDTLARSASKGFSATSCATDDTPTQTVSEGLSQAPAATDPSPLPASPSECLIVPNSPIQNPKSQIQNPPTPHTPHKRIPTPSPTSVTSTETPPAPNPSRPKPSAAKPWPPRRPNSALADDENFQPHDKWSPANDPLGQLYRRIEKQLASENQTRKTEDPHPREVIVCLPNSQS